MSSADPALQRDGDSKPSGQTFVPLISLHIHRCCFMVTNVLNLNLKSFLYIFFYPYQSLVICKGLVLSATIQKMEAAEINQDSAAI